MLFIIGGNHEYGSAETWQSYYARYPTPHEVSGSTNPCYWGKEVGVVHLIGLCSYAGFFENSTQYHWLTNYLATRLNRERTPWLVVMMHVPLYSSNTGHWGEGELFRLSVEPLLYEYGVDMILAGHVHSYERTVPVYNNKPNPCGPTYLNLGDGGNYEAAYVPWRNVTGTPTNSGSPWSAFRESSFGVGSFVILSETHANYSWHRHACMAFNSSTTYNANFTDSCVTPGDNSAQSMLTSDSVIIVRPSATECPNRWKSSETTADTNNILSQSTSCSSDSDSNSQKGAVIGLSIVVALLSIACIVMGVLLCTGGKKGASGEELLNENEKYTRAET